MSIFVIKITNLLTNYLWTHTNYVVGVGSLKQIDTRYYSILKFNNELYYIKFILCLTILQSYI